MSLKNAGLISSDSSLSLIESLLLVAYSDKYFSLFRKFNVNFLLISLFLFILFVDSRLQCFPMILARTNVSEPYFFMAFSTFL